MIQHLRNALAQLPPLRIASASFIDPSLSLIGPGWAFNSVSAWRLCENGVLLFGWSEKNVEEHIGRLVGNSIVSVEAQSRFLAGDPAFELSDGSWLEVFSDYPIDPWTLRLPGMTFVGSPSDATQVDSPSVGSQDGD
ncbi:hypothetical protein HJG52_00005 [Knoellia sp. DB2414S]|uniref:Uncharacterized protein n=1 Tax=Knoellia koreensis TaxID=2730921 RepID=A0A849H3L6_9MICO|nr:hypothetical protein [Knoellia sp. DB2414S]